MEKLKITYYRREQEGIQKVFESYDVDSIINWTITALYDGAIKRCKIRVDQYYVDGKEYCKIRATYTRLDPEYNEIKDQYIIENWSNDWGNFINVYDTFKNNNIEIEKGAK